MQYHLFDRECSKMLDKISAKQCILLLISEEKFQLLPRYESVLKFVYSTLLVDLERVRMLRRRNQKMNLSLKFCN